MPLDLADYDALTREALRSFWALRTSAAAAQAAGTDVGGRREVTAGGHLNGFIRLIAAVVEANGLPVEAVHVCRSPQDVAAALPGYYRATKKWDVLVVHGGRLVAAIETKSHVGPSFSNNFNNRSEEAVGMGEDLRVAVREGVVPPPRPFVGYLMVLEQTAASFEARSTPRARWPVDGVFADSSFADRYEVLCRRLVSEGLYDAAALLLTRRADADTGAYGEVSPETGMAAFVSGLASSVARAAALT